MAFNEHLPKKDSEAERAPSRPSSQLKNTIRARDAIRDGNLDASTLEIIRRGYEAQNQKVVDGADPKAAENAMTAIQLEGQETFGMFFSPLVVRYGRALAQQESTASNQS